MDVLRYKGEIMAQVRDGQVDAYIADIDHLALGVVHLTEKCQLSTDILLCAID